MKVITIDFETAWSSKDYTLSKMGPISYIRDPRFHAQMMGVRIDRNPVEVYDHEQIPAVLKALELHRVDRMVVGHNLNGFDALILSEVYDVHPALMMDTMAMMRWTGLSRMGSESHRTLTDTLKNGIKTEGTVISDGKRTREDFTPSEWVAFKKYCADDVLQCSENFYKMLPFMSPDAIRFSSLTAQMATNAIFRLDRGMLERYIQELDDQTEKARQDISAVFHFQTTEEFLYAIRSATKFAQMLDQLGVAVPTKYSEAKSETKRKQMEAAGEDTSDSESYAVYVPALAKTDLEFTAMQDHEDPRVALMVQTRLEQNSSGQRSRAVRFYDLAESGRPLPAMLNVFKAHTSRYTAGNSEHSSDGTNLQNLSKRNPNMLTLRRAIQAPAGYKVVSVDSSQIEARMLAWLAGQHDLVEQFRQGRDPYSELAEKIFNVPWEEIKAGAKDGDKRCKTYRNTGKLLILSSGYGVGKNKFSDSLLRSNAKLHSDLDKHRELAFNAHSIYRQVNANIVRFWDNCMDVIKALEAGISGSFAGPNNDTFQYGPMPLPDGTVVPSVQMPSGFVMRYPNLRWEANDKGRAEYMYDRPRGKNMVKTRIYGGAFCENCIAAGTEVLTHMGWKPIERVDKHDLVYDGVDFVRHQGLVSKGTQNCIRVDGVWMTPDHKVLTHDGWKEATYADDVQQLTRPELRGTVAERDYSPQLQESDRTDFWSVNCRQTSVFHREKVGVVGAMPLRNFRYKSGRGAGESCEATRRWRMQGVPNTSNGGPQPYTRVGAYTYIQCLAQYEVALRRAYLSCISEIRRAWYKLLRPLEDFSKLLRGHGVYLPAWACAGPEGQQWELLPGELSLGIIQGEQPEQSGRVCRRGYSGPIRSYGHIAKHVAISSNTRMAYGAANGVTRPWEHKATSVQNSDYIQAEVFDLVNCGPRSRFVVKGATGPVIVHNCTQGISFQLLMWQACRMAEAGVPLACNVHDAWIAVVPESEAQHIHDTMMYWMSRVPDWMPGFPVACEGEIGDDYTVA